MFENDNIILFIYLDYSVILSCPNLRPPFHLCTSDLFTPFVDCIGLDTVN
jgi:hypothetical protein